LASFEIHGLGAEPSHVARAVVRQNPFVTFAQSGKADAETAVRRFASGDGLKKQVSRRAPLHREELGADMCQAAGLRWNPIRFNQPIQRSQNPANGFD